MPLAGGMQDPIDCDRQPKSNPSALQQILTGLQTVSNDISSESQNLSAEYTKSTMDMSTQLGQNMNDAANQASESAGKASLIRRRLPQTPNQTDENRMRLKTMRCELENSAKSAGTEMKSSADSAAAKVKEKPW